MSYSCPSTDCPTHDSEKEYCAPKVAAYQFFPANWEAARFRRKPFPDETYRGAIFMAMNIAWNIGNGPDSIESAKADAVKVWEELVEVAAKFRTPHADFPGRCQMNILEFNKLWNGKVTTLLKWFQGKEKKKG